MGSITYFGMSFSKRYFLSRSVVTARKHSLPRLCFYRCMSVHSGKGRAWQGGMHGWGCVWQGGMHGRGRACHTRPPTHTLRDTVGQCAAIRILLECILVCNWILFLYSLERQTRHPRVGFHMVLPQQVPFGGTGRRGRVTCQRLKYPMRSSILRRVGEGGIQALVACLAGF